MCLKSVAVVFKSWRPWKVICPPDSKRIQPVTGSDWKLVTIWWSNPSVDEIPESVHVASPHTDSGSHLWPERPGQEHKKSWILDDSSHLQNEGKVKSHQIMVQYTSLSVWAANQVVDWLSYLTHPKKEVGWVSKWWWPWHRMEVQKDLCPKWLALVKIEDTQVIYIKYIYILHIYIYYTYMYLYIHIITYTCCMYTRYQAGLMTQITKRSYHCRKSINYA